MPQTNGRTTPKLTVIHLARKPLSGTVALNVLKHGTGGINIDACRIGLAFGEDSGQLSAKSGSRRGFQEDGFVGGIALTGRLPLWDATKGRWPANLVLQHLGGENGCKLVGTKKVTTNPPASYVVGSQADGEIRFTTKPVGFQKSSHTSTDGTETVPNWECVEGCPVKDLDEQSGILHSQDPSTRRGALCKTQSIFGNDGGSSAHYDDKGGASRFFKQVRGDE